MLLVSWLASVVDPEKNRVAVANVCRREGQQPQTETDIPHVDYDVTRFVQGLPEARESMAMRSA
jgi:hypothetical protein